MRKSCLYAIGAALTLGVAAPAAAETLTVEMLDYNTQAMAYVNNSLIPAFEAAHPGVKVETLTSSWSNLASDITTWYAGGVEPDVMQVGAQYIGLLAPEGLILPLDQFTRDWPDLSDFPKVEIDDATYHGHIYDIPYRLDQRGFLYREDLFAKDGLDPNKPPATWDELAADAKKLTILGEDGKFQQSGFGVSDYDQEYAEFLFQAGGRFLSSDLHTVTIADAKGIQAAQFESALVNQYHVSPPGGFGSITSLSSPQAMSYTGASPLSSTVQGIQIGAALPPMGPASRAGAVWINKWVIGSQSQDPKLAWDWIAATSAPETMAALDRLGAIVPPRWAMLQYAPWSDDARWKVYFDTAGITPAFRAQVPTENDFIHSNQQPITGALDDILNNRKSASVALNEVAQTEQAKLDQFWSQIESQEG